MSCDVRACLRPEIREMAPYVPGEQPRDGQAIKLNTNENPYPPSPSIARALASAAETLARYPDPLATAFRQEAARVLDVDADQILCGNGSDDILTIVTRAFVPTGGEVRFPSPSYILYRTLASLQGATFREVPFTDAWSWDERLLEDIDSAHLVYVPNPNSPTGTLISNKDLCALAEALPCPLLIDEAYVDFAPHHAVALTKRYPHVMVSRTLSKSYALAGLRFGYLVAHPDLIGVLRKVKDSYNTDALSIAAATAAMADQAWLKDNVARCIRTREALTAGLDRLGFATIPSHANFVWCHHPQHDAQSLYRFLKDRGLLVRYMAYEGWMDGLRISVGTDEAIAKLLALLAERVGRSGL